MMLSFIVSAREESANSPPSKPAASFDVRDFGAAGDGQTIDTAALQKAIDACAAAGGGRVTFPPGAYLSGTLSLRSGLTLQLEAGATLRGSTNLDHYKHFTPPSGTPEAKFRSTWHRALILGDGIEHVTLLGPGTIDGNKVFDPRGEERMRGPHTVLLGNSRHFRMQGLRMVDSANYAVMLEDCDQVEIKDVYFAGGWDGVHFRGWPGRPCRDVSIIGCQFYTGDDSIAGRYWENVVISDCIINSSCNGIRVIGPASQLIIDRCLFYGPGLYPHRTSNRYNMLAAINLQPGAWDRTEGLLDDVLISNCAIRNVTTPFHFMIKPGNTAGRITVERVSATQVYRAAASVESWADSPFTNVVFRQVDIEYTGGGALDQAKKEIKSPGVDARPLPAWGFYARNVQHLALEDVRLSAVQEDLRPVLIGEKIDRLTLDSLKYSKFKEAAGPILLDRVGQVEVPDSSLTRSELDLQKKP